MFNSEINILIVGSNDMLMSAIKIVLHKFGYTKLSTSPTYATAIRKMMELNFDLVIFDIAKSDMLGKDFVKNVISFSENSFRVGLSNNPDLKTILDLLEAGTQGFLIFPFTEESVQEVFNLVQKAHKFNESMFDSVNRIATFKALVLCNLNRLANAKQQLLRTGETTEDISALEKEFTKSVELAKEVARGHEEELLNQIVDGCLRAAKMPTTHLGRIRRKLREDGILKNAPALPPEDS